VGSVDLPPATSTTVQPASAAADSVPAPAKRQRTRKGQPAAAANPGLAHYWALHDARRLAAQEGAAAASAIDLTRDDDYTAPAAMAAGGGGGIMTRAAQSAKKASATLTQPVSIALTLSPHDAAQQFYNELHAACPAKCNIVTSCCIVCSTRRHG
jgi:hypothetical protein